MKWYFPDLLDVFSVIKPFLNSFDSESFDVGVINLSVNSALDVLGVLHDVFFCYPFHLGGVLFEYSCVVGHVLLDFVVILVRVTSWMNGKTNDFASDLCAVVILVVCHGNESNRIKSIAKCSGTDLLQYP